jgi:hypothetical protein
MRTVFEHCLVILCLDLDHAHVRRRCGLASKMSYLGRGVVIREKSDDLARDVGYPNVVEHLGVVERDFSGDLERDTYTRSERKEKDKRRTIRCMTPREMARLCIGAFMFATRSRIK